MIIRTVLLLALASSALGCKPVDIEKAEKAEQAERDEAAASTSAELAPPMEQLLVTSEQLDIGTEVTDEMVEVAEFPKKYVTSDMLVADSRGDIIGRSVAHAVPKGALLHERDFDSKKVGVAEAPALEPIVAAVAESPQRALADKARAAIIAKGNAAYVGTLTIAAGASVPEHRDPTEEFLYVLAGGGTITIDDTSHELSPDMVVFMPAGASVSFQNGETETRLVQVFAGPGPAAKYDSWDVVEPAE